MTSELEVSEITVVIPTFNRRERLEGALRSVLAETRVPIRVHVFDNASTDGTDAFLAKAQADDPRIHVFRQPENIGSDRNYMAALASVTTEFFVPLADDDWLKPEFLFKAWTALTTHPDCGAAAFFSDCENDAGTVLVTYPHAQPGTPEGYLNAADHMREFLLRGHYIWSAILWRKSVLDHVGYPYLHTGRPSDVDFQVAAFSRFPVVLSREIGAVYTSHDGQYSAGFSVRDIPSFAWLVMRMDQSTAPLFSREEYTVLRQCFFDRYSRIWRRPPRVPLNPSERLQLAAIAGVRLGDWMLAAELTGPQAVPDPGGSLLISTEK